MLKVKMLSSGEIITVTPNVAHGLIDSEKAVLVTGEVEKPIKKYKPRKMRASTPKYRTRQMRASTFKSKKKRQKVMKGYKSK